MHYNTGGGRPTAVAPQPLGLWRCFQGKSWSLYLYFAYKSGLKRVRAILKAVEAVKVKLWCFKGIVNPTHFQKHVGWGTWLAFPPLPCHSPPKSVGQKAIAPPGGDQEKTAGESFTEKLPIAWMESSITSTPYMAHTLNIKNFCFWL